MQDLFVTEELVGHRRTKYVSSRHWLLRIASAVVILNLVDAIFTLVYVNGFAVPFEDLADTEIDVTVERPEPILIDSC